MVTNGGERENIPNLTKKTRNYPFIGVQWPTQSGLNVEIGGLVINPDLVVWFINPEVVVWSLTRVVVTVYRQWWLQCVPTVVVTVCTDSGGYGGSGYRQWCSQWLPAVVLSVVQSVVPCLTSPFVQ